MDFGSPSFLLLFLAFVPLTVALIVLTRWRRVVVRSLAGANARARVHRRRRALKVGLVLLALAIIAVGAARPRYGSRPVLLPQEGLEIMVVLDGSFSMLAVDVEPNRFERAKAMLDRLLMQLAGDKVGLVVFAGDAQLRFPLTNDMAAAREIVRTTNLKEGGLAPSTRIEEGLRVGLESFPSDGQARNRILLLVSDGEREEGQPEAAILPARAEGVPIWTVGVGTEAGGAIIFPASDSTRGSPLVPPSLRTAQPSREAGYSYRDQAMLLRLAEETNGRHFDGNAIETAPAIADAISHLNRSRFESQEATLPIERFQWLAATGLLLLAAAYLVPETQRSPTPAGARRSRSIDLSSQRTIRSQGQQRASVGSLRR